MTGGKIIAGLICGIAAAVPGWFLIGSIIGMIPDVILDPQILEFGPTLAAIGVCALVTLVSRAAPTIRAAWFRGCLIVTIFSGILTYQMVQCFGLRWYYDALLGMRMPRYMDQTGCMGGDTLGVAIMAGAFAVVFGVATVLVRRKTGPDV